MLKTTNNKVEASDNKPCKQCKLDFAYVITMLLGHPILICEHEQEIAFKASISNKPRPSNRYQLETNLQPRIQ